MNDLRFPVGAWRFEGSVTAERRGGWIDQIEAAPAQVRAAVSGLTDPQLNTPYRPDGWTVRQVVHHLPDSHLNAYTRFRLALTERHPTIRPYDEAGWAELLDARTAPVEVSLTLLAALHQRWVILLRALDPAEFARGLRHPGHGRDFSLDEVLGMYAWHGRHHTAHIVGLCRRMGGS